MEFCSLTAKKIPLNPPFFKGGNLSEDRFPSLETFGKEGPGEILDKSELNY